MSTISGFWDVGPHAPFPVEGTWRTFVRHIGGTVVEDVIPEPRDIENADFYFSATEVVAELKEVETAFSHSPAFRTGFSRLMERVVQEDPTWRPALFGGSGQYPAWFQSEFVRLFRPPISRILKKANRQIRDTKAFFKVRDSKGVLLFVNDGFTSLGPGPIRALTSDLLLHSYTSIDCLVYLTVNTYIAFPGDQTPRLLWVPTYSDRAPDELVELVDELGRQWFSYIEELCGPYTDRLEQSQPPDLLSGAHAIRVPSADDA